MLVQSLQLTPKLEEFVAAQIASGRYRDAGEVVRAGLHQLDREQKLKQEDDAKMEALVQAIDEGEGSGIYEGDPFEDIRQELGLSSRIRA